MMHAAGSDHQPYQHQDKDRHAPRHVAAQRFKLHRIGVWNLHHHQRAKRERGDDEQCHHPMQHHQCGVISGNHGHGCSSWKRCRRCLAIGMIAAT
jgi:hypothetical protein